MKYVWICLSFVLFFLGYGLHDMADVSFAQPLVLIPGAETLFTASESSGEVASPDDRVPESSILVLPDKVVIELKGAVWSTFTDTNSMDPVIDIGTNAIQIIPQRPEEIQRGDIISYHSHLVDGIIIHRVVEIGTDGDGWFARTKGDNNPDVDPEKVRFKDVKRVVVAVIY